MKARFQEAVSRRSFVGCGLGSLACAPFAARAAGSQPPPSRPADRAATPSGKDQPAVAASSDAAQHLTIEVTIDEHGPFHFVVDTGADRTVIADDVAAALGLIPDNRVMVEGIIRTIPVQSVKLSQLSFGSIRKNDLIAPVVPRTLLAADGYLGLDVIDGYRVTFDFLHKELKIGQSPANRFGHEFSRHESRITAYGSQGRLRAINCHVDDVQATAFIDSGAQVSTGNSRLLAELVAQRKSAYTEIGKLPLTGVTGGTVEGGVIPIDAVRIGNLKFQDSLIVIADLQIFELWGLSDTPALLIGVNFLRKFAQVSIDYGAKEIRFELADLARLARRG